MTAGAIGIGAIPSIPAPGGEGMGEKQSDLYNHIQKVDRENLLVHWPFNELEGTTVYDHSGNDHHARYSSSGGLGSTVLGPDGAPCFYMAGAHWVDMYSTGLSDVWLSDATWTMSMYVKYPDTGSWIDGAFRNQFGYISGQDTGGTAPALYHRKGLPNNQMDGLYWPRDPFVGLSWSYQGANDTNWFHMALQSDSASGEFRIWHNGVKVWHSTASTGLWTDAGLQSTQSAMGALWSADTDGTGGGGQGGTGALSNFAYWTSYLSSGQIEALAKHKIPKYKGEGYLFYDEFSDTDATNLDTTTDGHMPDFPDYPRDSDEAVNSMRWMDIGTGTHTIVSNKARGTVNDGDQAYVPLGIAPADEGLIISAAMDEGTSDSGDPGIIFRGLETDTAQWWAAILDKSANSVIAYNYNGSLYDNKGEASVTWTADDVLKIHDVQGIIDIYQNDTLVLHLASTVYDTNTAVGIRTGWNDTTQSWDDFTVSTGDPVQMIWLLDNFDDSQAWIDAVTPDITLPTSSALDSDGMWQIASTTSATDQWETSNGVLRASGGQAGYGWPMINMGSTFDDIYIKCWFQSNTINAAWPGLVIGDSAGGLGSYIYLQQQAEANTFNWIDTAAAVVTSTFASTHGDTFYMEIFKSSGEYVGYVENTGDTTESQTITLSTNTAAADWTWVGINERPTFGEGAQDYFQRFEVSNYSTK